MNEPEKPKKGWGWLQWGVVMTVIAGGLLLCISIARILSDMANQEKAFNNLRESMTALKIWAEENNGAYPDASFQERPTANQVFRKLIQDEVVMDERIFGSKMSFFNGDGKIGVAPAFDQAVQAGENHWMITAGLNSKSPGETPLIFENAISSTWPLRWFSSHQGERIRGRVWTGGKIIVGFQDNSINLIKLTKQGDVMVLPDTVMIPNGTTPLPSLKILDIE